jgi:hypothetical protein
MGNPRHRPPDEDPADGPKPGGATAVTAAVLAMLGGSVALAGLVLGLTTLLRQTPRFGPAFIGLGISVVVAGLLLPGGILLLRGKPVGRQLVIAGSSLAIVLYLAYLLVVLLGAVGGFAGVGAFAVLLFLVPAVATLVLAAVTPTARWLGDGARPRRRYPPRYPPRQGGRPPGW